MIFQDCPIQSFSVLSQLTFWARTFFVFLPSCIFCRIFGSISGLYQWQFLPLWQLKNASHSLPNVSWGLGVQNHLQLRNHRNTIPFLFPVSNLSPSHGCLFVFPFSAWMRQGKVIFTARKAVSCLEILRGPGIYLEFIPHGHQVWQMGLGSLVWWEADLASKLPCDLAAITQAQI